MSENPEPVPRLEYEYDAEVPASVAIVRAIATVEDVDPTTLATRYGRTLSDYVDPGDVDSLVEASPDTDEFVIEFAVYGYRVRIEETTCVLVYDHPT